MNGSAFFTEILIVLVTATLIAFLFERLRLPAVLGFLMAGVLIGPQGLALLSDLEDIHHLAELGMIFLMLTIGLEFSFEKLRGLKRLAFVGGTAQLLLSILLGLGVARGMGWTLFHGFLLGSVIALSSTAIVLKHLLDRAELDTSHGRVALSILLFQDMAVAPILIVILAFGRAPESVGLALAVALAKAAVLLTVVLVLSRYVLPPVMRRITLSDSREIFILAAVVICLGSAWLSARLGLSSAIGAFFAGIMLANTDYAHQISGEIAVFRHIFVSLFFVSIGLLFHPGFVFLNFPIVFLMVVLILFVNCIIMTGVVMVFGYPPRVALITGLILSQIGEFSFLLLQAARGTGLIGDFFYQSLLSAAMITIFFTPFLFALVPHLMRWVDKIPFFGAPPSVLDRQTPKTFSLSGHIILCGYGKAGRDLAAAMKEEKIPYIIVEMNPVHLRDARRENDHVLYGDASNAVVLKKAGLEKAKTLVVSFGDSTSLAEIVRTAQRIHPDVTLVVRTRFEKDVAWLYELGADVVVMEELEMSVELTRVMLESFGISKDKIQRYIHRIRSRKEWMVEQKILKRLK